MCAGRPFTPNLTAVPDERRVVVYPGANWIHDLDETTNPLYRAALRMRVTLHATSPDHDPGVDACVFDRGRVVPPDVYARARERYRWIRTHWNVSGDDASYEGMVRQTIADSHAVYGECGDVELRVLRWMTDLMANTLASPLGRVLKAPYAHAGTDSGDALVEGGYFQILRHVADEYPLDVRFGHRVTSVVDELTGVRVVCRTAVGDETTLSARACLVTLPVGVLHSNAVAFVPRVPAHIRRVAASVSSGTMNLVWLWYPTAFWPQGYNLLPLMPLILFLFFLSFYFFFPFSFFLFSFLPFFLFFLFSFFLASRAFFSQQNANRDNGQRQHCQNAKRAKRPKCFSRGPFRCTGAQVGNDLATHCAALIVSRFCDFARNRPDPLVRRVI